MLRIEKRIQIGISRDHNSARIKIDETEIDLPISSWSSTGALTLNVPWDLVDFAYPFDNKEILVDPRDNDEFGDYHL